MSVIEVTMYRVQCDAEGCDESPQSEEYYAWLQVEGALEDLSQAWDWHTEGDKHLCPEHAPTCAADGCRLPLRDREWGDFCEDHAPDETTPNESLAAAPHAQPSLSVIAPNDASTASPIATDTPSALREKTK